MILDNIKEMIIDGKKIISAWLNGVNIWLEEETTDNE